MDTVEPGALSWPVPRDREPGSPRPPGSCVGTGRDSPAAAAAAAASSRAVRTPPGAAGCPSGH